MLDYVLELHPNQKGCKYGSARMEICGCPVYLILHLLSGTTEDASYSSHCSYSEALKCAQASSDRDQVWCPLSPIVRQLLKLISES